MNTVKEKLKKKEYRNWVKGTLGLERTNRALFEYVKAKFVLCTHSRAGSHAYFTEDVYSHIHLGTSCIRSNLKRKIKYDKTNDTWKWKNPCGKCEKAFKTILSMHTNASKKLREARNKLFHSSDNMVNDKVLKNYFRNMKGLLQDASNDTEVDNSIREVIGKDKQTIEKLEEAEISMTLFDDALKIQRKAIYEDYETCLQNNDIEQLKVLLKLAENVASDLQFMNDHSEELKNLNQQQQVPNDISVLTRGMMRLKMGACFSWQSVRDNVTQLDAEGMIIIVIVTIGMALLLSLLLYFV